MFRVVGTGGLPNPDIPSSFDMHRTPSVEYTTTLDDCPVSRDGRLVTCEHRVCMLQEHPALTGTGQCELFTQFLSQLICPLKL